MNRKVINEYEPMDCPPPVGRQARIIICAVQVPFIAGGAESHIESLRRELAARDYLVDVVRLPFKWHPVRQMINDAMAWRLLDLTTSYGLPVDLAICTRFPSYCIRHTRKIAWILHQHRQAYDFLNTRYSDFTDSPDDDEVRKLLYEIDTRSLRECRDIFANSKNVADRLDRFLNIKSRPLYHPPPLTGKYHTRSYDDYIFTAGRLEMNKRPDMFLKALSLCQHPIRAVIAGKGPMEATLKNMACELDLDQRVTFTGYVSDDELLNHYSRCGAVWYAPLDEDYGYVTLEAFLSGKPVITSNDSGGVLEFVEDGVTGFIGIPDPHHMAEQLDRWYNNRQNSPGLGKKARLKAERITWDNVIHNLTESLRIDVENQKKDIKDESCET